MKISIEQKVADLLELARVGAEIEVAVETDVAERQGFVGDLAYELALMRLQCRDEIEASKRIRVMSLRQVV
jgi:hypothetical protein